MDEHDEFLSELQQLKAKYEIYGMYVYDFDDESANAIQMSKFAEVDGKKMLFFGYHSDGKKICPCCKEKE